jgi:hypothetical protein
MHKRYVRKQEDRKDKKKKRKKERMKGNVREMA